MLLFISGPEIFVVLLLVVMLFGADKIPEIARGLGKGMRQIKDATNDIKKEINESAEKNDLNLDVTKDIQKEIDEVKENIEKATGLKSGFNSGNSSSSIVNMKSNSSDKSGPIGQLFLSSIL